MFVILQLDLITKNLKREAKYSNPKHKELEEVHDIIFEDETNHLNNSTNVSIKTNIFHEFDCATKKHE